MTSLVSGFFHGGIGVADMERSLAFYRDLLGLEVHFDVTLDAVEYVRHALGIEMRDCRIVYLRVPGSEGVFVELLEYHGTDARPTAEPRPWDPGTGHLCLYVTDTQAVLDQAIGAGYRTRSTSARLNATHPAMTTPIVASCRIIRRWTGRPPRGWRCRA